MGLFRRFSNEGRGDDSFAFRLPWRPESDAAPARIESPLVFCTNLERPGLDAMEPFLRSMVSENRPLVIVTPGVERGTAEALRARNVTAIRAASIGAQRLDDLLGDLAIVTGGIVLSVETGFGLAIDSAAPDATAGGIVLPKLGWADVAVHDLGRATAVERDGDDVVFHSAPGKYVAGRMTLLKMQLGAAETDEEAAALRARLARLGDGAPTPVAAAEAATLPAGIAIPCGYTSDYFITDPARLWAVHDGPRVLITDAPLESLDSAVPLLEAAMRSGSPLVVIAPRVCGAALAAMVVNNVRGVVSSLAIDAAEAGSERLAALRAATGATPYRTEHAADVAACFGRASRVVATARKTVVVA